MIHNTLPHTIQYPTILTEQNGSFQAIHGNFCAPTSDIQSILPRKSNCDEEKDSGAGEEERQSRSLSTLVLRPLC